MADDLKFISDIFQKAGVPLDGDDVWEVQRVRVVKHKALERLGAGMGIEFDAPQILRCEGDEAVILATGRMNGKSEWSIGEAKIVRMVDSGRKNQWNKPVYEPAPGELGNYQITPKQASYPFAMAEKRAKDRVILKLSGLHGVYSEEEADDFKQSAQPQATTQYRESAGDEIAGYVAHCKTGILNHTDRDGLVAYWKQEADNRATLRLKPGVPEYDDLFSAYKARGLAISQHREAAE